jgi:hypothetical protein
VLHTINDAYTQENFGRYRPRLLHRVDGIERDRSLPHVLDTRLNYGSGKPISLEGESNVVHPDRV